MVLFSLLLALTAFSETPLSSTPSDHDSCAFDYLQQGKEWGQNYSLCLGTTQSPIDINTSLTDHYKYPNLEQTTKIQPINITLKAPTPNLYFSLKNNGHSLGAIPVDNSNGHPLGGNQAPMMLEGK